MSRLENKKKAGYFPTPPRVVELIAGHLAPPVFGGTTGEAPPSADYRWLDPCAGEGAALAYLASRLGGRTFGIELDRQRAEAAAQVLDRVIASDFQAVQMPKTNPGISVLFLNPPYDHDDDTGRLELTFLRESQDWLMPGGVLIYIIPEYRITMHVARRLATYFRDVKIYSFPWPDYQQFRQVVIFAIKRHEPVKDEEEAARIFSRRFNAPVLGPRATHPYQIPPQPEHTFYFRRIEADPMDVAAEADKVGVWSSKAWSDLLTPLSASPRSRGDQGGAIQPLMPLRRGHIAMVLAAGLLDNMEVTRDAWSGASQGTRLLVKGRLVKTEHDVSTDQERKDGIQRTRESFQASISTLNLDTGQFQTIAGDTGLRSWLTQWQETLAARIVETFQPLHRMNYDGLPGFQEITASHSKHRRLPGQSRTGLFEAQRQAVAALTRRFLAGHKFAWLQATMGTGKTTIAISLADVLKKMTSPRRPFPVIVVCPPHLVEKWPREIAGVVPMARATVVRRPSDLEAYVRELRFLDPRTLSVAVVSSEMLKRGSGWTPAVITRQVTRKVKSSNCVWRNGKLVQETLTVTNTFFFCPRCGQPIVEPDERGNPTRILVTDPDYFKQRRVKCLNTVKKWVGDPGGARPASPGGDNSKGHWEETTCEEPLYQEWRGWWPQVERDPLTGSIRPIREVAYPIAQYVRRRYPGFFELAIVDEAHEYKGQSTDRGDAFGVLARTSKRALGMTGTLFGGMVTSLFYLLHRVDPRVRAEFAWSDGQRFAALYGVLERVTKAKEDDDGYGHYTGLRRARTRVIERPGISPALVTKLLDSTVFLALEDLGFELPDYREHPVDHPHEGWRSPA